MGWHQGFSPHLFRAFGPEELREIPNRRGRVGSDHITDAGHRSRSGHVLPRTSEVRRGVKASLAEREGKGSIPLSSSKRAGEVYSVVLLAGGSVNLSIDPPLMAPRTAPLGNPRGGRAVVGTKAAAQRSPGGVEPSCGGQSMKSSVRRPVVLLGSDGPSGTPTGAIESAMAAA